MRLRNILSIGAALSAIVGLTGSVSAKQVSLQAALAEPVMLGGKKKTTFLKVGLTGFEFSTGDAERPPANVAIVLDKSGSMGGAKIARAREAAKMAVERLGPNDIVSIIAYDTTVSVVVPATKVADKEAIFEMIDGIKPGGNTALFAGVSKGAAEVRKFRGKDRVNRVILVSDGIANRGPSTPGALGELGVSLRKEGISVSTLGLGEGYNEDLMFKLAEKSDGNHSFAESGERLVAILDEEFGDVLSVAAQEVLVKIECQPGVRPVRVLGREAEISGQSCTVLLNQIYSKQEKYVLLEVEVPATAAGKALDVANVSVSYANMATKLTDELSSKVAARFTADAKEVVLKTNKDVMVSCVMQVATLTNEKAMKLRDDGNVEEAQQLLMGNGAYLTENADRWGSKELETFGMNNAIDADNLKGKAWVNTRKAMRADQSKNYGQQQRAYNTRHSETYSQPKKSSGAKRR